MHSARLRNSAFEVDLDGADQQALVVEASTDLIHWVAMSNAPVGGQLADPEAGRFQQRFYRIVRDGGMLQQTTEIELK
jgi:hypothetical protein